MTASKASCLAFSACECERSGDEQLSYAQSQYLPSHGRPTPNSTSYDHYDHNAPGPSRRGVRIRDRGYSSETLPSPNSC